MKINFGLQKYVFGCNYNFSYKKDENFLTTLTIPAENEEEAWDRLIAMVGRNNSKKFRINDVTEY